MFEKIYQIRCPQGKTMGFQYNKRPFIIGFVNVNHTRVVQYNTNFQKPNIRLRLNRPKSIYKDIKKLAELKDNEALGDVILNNIMIDTECKMFISKHNIQRLRQDVTYKELVEWYKYTQHVGRIHWRDFFLIPMQKTIGISLVYELCYENDYEFCFACQVLFPREDDETNTQNYRKILEKLSQEI